MVKLYILRMKLLFHAIAPMHTIDNVLIKFRVIK